MRIIKKIIKSSIEYVLAPLGFKLARNFHHLAYRTPPSEIISLIKKLRPVSISTPLIRFGPNSDGGYLIPDDLKGVSSCFSPGVSAISGFEIDCAQRGMKVLLADKSVDSPKETHLQFQFEKKYVGAYRDDDFITLDDWVLESQISPDEDSILQMDIEGYEYEALLSLSNLTQARFRIIVIEFHSLDQLWNQPFFNLSSRVFEKLLQTHDCVHIHPNNYSPPIEHNGISIPPLLEMTFLRKDRVIKSAEKLTFPHDLDFDNTKHTSLSLPDIWYK